MKFASLPKSVEGLTSEDLKELRKKLYQEAVDQNFFGIADKIAVNLGTITDHRYNKYQFIAGDLRIFSDHYGRYLSVYWKEKKVAENHSCTRLFIPGEWIVEFEKLIRPAIEAEIKHKQETERRKVNELCDELGIDARI